MLFEIRSIAIGSRTLWVDANCFVQVRQRFLVIPLQHVSGAPQYVCSGEGRLQSNDFIKSSNRAARIPISVEGQSSFKHWTDRWASSSRSRWLSHPLRSSTATRLPPTISPERYANYRLSHCRGSIPRCAAAVAPYQLHVVIHRELVRVGAKTQCVVFFLFHVDPVGDEVFVEDVAAQQEGMIGLERFDCAAE